MFFRSEGSGKAWNTCAELLEGSSHGQRGLRDQFVAGRSLTDGVLLTLTKTEYMKEFTLSDGVKLIGPDPKS